MHEEIISFVEGPGECTDKIPAAISLGWSAWSAVKLVSRPINRLQRHGIEAIRIDDGGLVVVPLNGDFALIHHLIETLARIGAITDDVPKAENLLEPLFLQVGQHDTERLEIGVNVTDQSTLHAMTPSGLRYDKRTGVQADDDLAERPEEYLANTEV